MEAFSREETPSCLPACLPADIPAWVIFLRREWRGARIGRPGDRTGLSKCEERKRWMQGGRVLTH